jgi:hypothetical protein
MGHESIAVWIMGGVNTALLILLCAFGKLWTSRVDRKLDSAVPESECKDRRDTLGKKICLVKEENKNLWRHKHAPIIDGKGGEVIIP